MTQVQAPEPHHAAYEAFLEAYPDYRNTTVLDEIRSREFGRLDEQRQVYLDYTGAGLYAVSLLRTKKGGAAGESPGTISLSTQEDPR